MTQCERSELLSPGTSDESVQLEWMSESLKEFHRLHAHEKDKLTFMRKLFEVVTGMFSDLTQSAQQEGSQRVTADAIFTAHANLFGRWATQDWSLRTLLAGLKSVQAPPNMAGDDLLLAAFRLFMDDLSPDDTALVGQIKSELESRFTVQLANEPDLERLRGFTFEQLCFTDQTDPCGGEPTEETLRLAAELDPSNAAVVQQWFERTHNFQQAIDFYNRFRSKLTRTASLYAALGNHLIGVQRFADAIKAFDAARNCAEKDGMLPQLECRLLYSKALCYDLMRDYREACRTFEAALASYPEDGLLHYQYSRTLYSASVEHADRAAHLCHADPHVLKWAGDVKRPLMGG